MTPQSNYKQLQYIHTHTHTHTHTRTRPQLSRKVKTTRKFGQLIEFNKRNIFLEKSCRK